MSVLRTFSRARRQPCLYRIHEGPTAEKLEALRNFLKEFGIGLGGGDDPTARDYAELLESIKDRPDAQLLQTVMLRSLRQAMYSPDNVGHFGLSYEHYTHFTSPIRRYPDLLVHRSIKAVLAGTHYAPGKWDDIGLHCSMTERRADEATRDVGNWLKCYYMRDRIGECFAGTIAAVVPFRRLSSPSTRSMSRVWCMFRNSARSTFSTTASSTRCSASAPAAAIVSVTACR
jgi:ribonuclease R